MIVLGVLANPHYVQGHISGLLRIGRQLVADLVKPFHSRYNAKQKVRRNGQHWTHDIGHGDGDQSGSHVAPDAVLLRMGDRYVPPDGQSDRQPDADCVTYLREYRMEEHYAGPPVAALLLPAVVQLREDVLIERVRDIVDHHHQIGYGQPSQNGIGGRAHVTPSQHCNIQAIRYTSKDAHEQAHVAMDRVVAAEEKKDR